jgi:hypothetical protein
MGFRETVDLQRAQQREDAARRERQGREDRERVADFIGIMIERHVDPVAIYRQTKHVIQREEGIFRRRMVDTAQRRYTHLLVDRGWPITEAGDSNDSNPRILTIAEEGGIYTTSYPVNQRHPDTPEVPYVITTSDLDGPHEVGGRLGGEMGESKLAYAVLRLVGTEQ